MGQADPLDGSNVASPACSLTGLGDLSIVGRWPGARRGFARSWRARSVDLTGADFSRLQGETRSPDHEVDPIPGPGADELVARLRRLLRPDANLLTADNGPLAWPHPFFPFQRDGIATLLRANHLLLGDEMGLGKTIQAIAAVRVLIHLRRVQSALVVAPAGLIAQWMRALAEWAPELSCIAATGPAQQRGWRWAGRTHVTVASYETVRADCQSARSQWDIVILDEAQRIKNSVSQIADACKSLPRIRSWALSGTPLENSIADLESILDFVLDRPSRIDSIQRAATLLSLTQLRRRKRDVVAQLPPKLVMDVPIEMGRRQRNAYDRAQHQGIVALRELREVTISHVFGLIIRLKQICNFEPASGESSKIDDLHERLAEIVAGGNKVLVFSQFADDVAGVERIAGRLSAYRPLIYSGKLSRDQRDRTLQQFDNDDDRPLLVVSLKAGGSGLNLQRASYVFHFDRWWNPAAEAQAEDRVHRMGQTKGVNVYRYSVAHSIEQRIDDLIRAKRELFETVVEQDGEAVPLNLNREDLLRLVDSA